MRSGDATLIKGDGIDIFLQSNFLSAEKCAFVIHQIDRTCLPSSVFPPSDDLDYRTSSTSFLCYDELGAVASLENEIAAFIGVPAAYAEGIQGQRYAVGEQFKAHYDFFESGDPQWSHQLSVRGQRTWTVMICLQKAEEGGETYFPNAGVRLALKAGTLVAWSNLMVDGRENYASLHAGEPVLRGQKYILTKWFRSKPQMTARLAGSIENVTAPILS